MHALPADRGSRGSRHLLTCLALGALALCGAPAAAQDAVQTCLNTTGYAIRGYNNSGVTIDGSLQEDGLPAFQSGSGSTVYCEPYAIPGSFLELGGSKGAALLGLVVSNGISAGLGALANAVVGAQTEAFLNMELHLRFGVEAPGPPQTPVPARLASRVLFGTVISSQSGFGQPLNNLSTLSGIRIVEAGNPSFVVQPYLVPWLGGISTGAMNEIHSQPFELRTGTLYDLQLRLTARSRATGNVSPGVDGTVNSTSAASMSFEWTFALLTGDTATTQFAYQDALGLAAPALGSVSPVPVPPAALLCALPLACLLHRRGRRRGHDSESGKVRTRPGDRTLYQ